MHAEAAIRGLGTAVPATRVPQELARDVVTRWAGLDGKAVAWARRVFDRAGVGERRTIFREVLGGLPPFGGVARPGTAARMALYREHAGPLAAAAARRALDAAGVDARDVTHLVVVSCTGFHAPGIDVELLAHLGLRDDVERVVVGFMGCYGAFAGLRVARGAVRADPRAIALVVCVELCTLHLRADHDPQSLVAHALFGDGAGAAVVTSALRGGEDLGPEALGPRAAGGVVFDLGPAACRVDPGTDAMMGWTIGDDGFEMTLAAAVPERVGACVAEFAAGLVPRDDVDVWCVHPGGPAILAAAERALSLAPNDLDDARAVLRTLGNVSSATILFVLERTAARVGAGTRGVALGFGPGLTLEGFGFRRGTRAVTSPAWDAAAVAAATARP